MKTSSLLVLSLSCSNQVFGQGSLTPPGASMKTRAQVEPRTTVSVLPFTISTPGSYSVTKNLVAASGDGINFTDYAVACGNSVGTIQTSPVGA